MTIHPEVPNSLEAEQAVLGSVLLRPAALVEIADVIQPGDFYRELHGKIYAAMLECHRRGIPPDTRMVVDQLSAEGITGLIAQLTDFVEVVPTSQHIGHYAEVVRKLAVRRKLIAAGGKIAMLGYDLHRDFSEVLADAQAVLTDAIRVRAGHHAVPIREVVDQYHEDIASGVLSGLPTGLDDYDNLTGGLHPGNLIVFAARPGHGKSAIALTISDLLSEKGIPVLFFSLEMPRIELMQRLLAMHSKVDLLAIRNRRLSEGELQRVINAMGIVHNRPILVDDSAALTISEVRTRALREATKHDQIGLIVVDYLQRVKITLRNGENRAAAVGDISSGLKDLAKELECPVLALAQMSRQIDHRAEKEPELADLRESGDIEADADQVGFIVRPELYDKQAERGSAHLYLKKQRNGPLGTIPLYFNAATTRFHSLDRWRSA